MWPSNAKIALDGVEAGKEDDFAALATYLKAAMIEDPEFADLIQQMAQAIEQPELAQQVQSQTIQSGGVGW